MSHRKEEILRVARHLFLTKDYEQTTMSDIMTSLNIAKGTIYHYFKSKEALFEAVIEDMVEKKLLQMKSIVTTASGTALEKIQLLIESGNLSEENEEILAELHKPANDSLHTRLLASTLMKQAPLYAELIQQGCNEGIFTTDAPLETAEFVLAAIQFLTDMGIYPWSEEVLKRRAQAFPEIIERLLQAPTGSFKFLITQI